MRRWVSRFNAEGMAGLANRSRSGRPRLGGRRLTRRIAELLARPGPWTLPRTWRYLAGRRSARASCTGGCGWRSGGGPKLAARGDPAITTSSLKNYMAVVTWPGRLRQIHFFFHSRSPGQMLDTAAPLTSPGSLRVTNRTFGMPLSKQQPIQPIVTTMAGSPMPQANLRSRGKHSFG